MIVKKRFMRVRLVPLLVGICLSPTWVACSSKDAADDQSAIDLVDPDDAYGKSYAAWSLDWISYVNAVSPPECSNPLMSDTGADCALYQDEASPAFFLVGNFGGVSIRSECVAPAGKALFFPIINIWGDNAGVPADMLLSDDDIKAYVESKFDDIPVDSVYLSVDGDDLADLTRGSVRSTPYLLDLVPGANSYYCAGTEEVDGEFPGYIGGYWAMLPPLPAGSHTLEFGGTAKSTSTSEADLVKQTYNLTVR
jgi:hypothetical protein